MATLEVKNGEYFVRLTVTADNGQAITVRVNRGGLIGALKYANENCMDAEEIKE